MSYRLILTDTQAAVVSEACEALARIYIGQTLPYVMAHIGSQNHERIRDAADALEKEVHGRAIGRFDTPEVAQIAWDLYQTIRHCLAYQRCPEGGHTVDFHTPMHMSDEPLPQIEPCNGVPDHRPERQRLSDELVREIGTDDLKTALAWIRSWRSAALCTSLRERRPKK